MPPGQIWMFNNEVLFVSRFHDLIAEHEWHKYLENQRKQGRHFISSLVIQTRFELGLPLK